MNDELVEDVVRLAKIMHENFDDSAYRLAAAIIEHHMRDLELEGRPVTREALHEAIKATLTNALKMPAA